MQSSQTPVRFLPPSSRSVNKVRIRHRLPPCRRVPGPGRLRVLFRANIPVAGWSAQPSSVFILPDAGGVLGRSRWLSVVPVTNSQCRTEARLLMVQVIFGGSQLRAAQFGACPHGIRSLCGEVSESDAPGESVSRGGGNERGTQGLTLQRGLLTQKPTPRVVHIPLDKLLPAIPKHRPSRTASSLFSFSAVSISKYRPRTMRQRCMTAMSRSRAGTSWGLGWIGRAVGVRVVVGLTERLQV